MRDRTYAADWIAAFALGLAASGLRRETCIDELASVVALEHHLLLEARDRVCRGDGCDAVICREAEEMLCAAALAVNREVDQPVAE